MVIVIWPPYTLKLNEFIQYTQSEWFVHLVRKLITIFRKLPIVFSTYKTLNYKRHSSPSLYSFLLLGNN